MTLDQELDGGDHVMSSFCDEDHTDTNENTSSQEQNERLIEKNSLQEAPEVEMIKQKVLPTVERASIRHTSMQKPRAVPL